MALLETVGVNVRFGGHHAVRDVDLVVDAGIVTGLIGPNGAGKTTTFNVITGLQETTSGRVLLEGDDIGGLKAHKRARLGIARTFQRLEVFGSLSARENLLVAAEIRKGWSGDKTDPTHVVEEIIERVGIGAVADERVDSMPTGLARLVELGRALATQPKVLLLDEPASGLDDSESESFADLLVELAADGMAVLMVEHDVQLVMRVCKLVHVLDFGAIIAVGTPDEIQRNEKVLEAYLGTSA
ncbi:MAG: ABC transporter ATP-binding protein [Actinobacteria bacterium]|nr:ABC transporter ATP-binding protein [Actinomycetota bacterium]MBV9663466.1 ABC transporter ATP-binding protein [Actinomycetota bacterium]MBV9933273.1 ABC transporter ATP-binding protein [Actinomycetota bacterium]